MTATVAMGFLIVALRRVSDAEAPAVERVQVGDITIAFARHRASAATTNSASRPRNSSC